jgi:hypothetical protein
MILRAGSVISRQLIFWRDLNVRRQEMIAIAGTDYGLVNLSPVILLSSGTPGQHLKSAIPAFVSKD